MKAAQNKTNENLNHIDTQKKARIFALKIFVITLVTGFILAGAWEVNRYYQNKIFPRVEINGISVGNLTEAAANEKITDFVNKLDNDGPILNYEGEEFHPKLSEIGITFNEEQIVKEAYQFGHNGGLKARLRNLSKLFLNKVSFSLSPQIDETKLDAYLGQIAEVVELEPKNARLEVKTGEIILYSAQNGRGLDKNKFKNDLAALVSSGKPNGAINLETTDLSPAIDELGTIEARETANKYLASAPLELSFENEVFSVDRAQVLAWLSFKEDGARSVAYLDEVKMKPFVKQIAKRIEIAKVDKEVLATNGKVVKEGKNGRGLDETKLMQEIKGKITAGVPASNIILTVYDILPEEKLVYPSFDPNLFEGRWIDVNLSEQRLRLIENKQKVGEYIISTGKWSTPTPTGTRYIENKITRAWSNEYKLYMPWWQSLGGGYGIHELPEWPNGYKEGANHLGSPVSHGCIRLGVGPAETVYNWAPIGTPVYIHR